MASPLDGPIYLKTREILPIEDGAGLEVKCLWGTLWITQDGDREDRIIDGGESYVLDRPGYMNDPVADTAKNMLIAAHCVSGSRIAGFEQKPAPYILRSHSESGLGVSVQVLWPVGAVVSLIRFQNPNELIIDTGTVVRNIDTPPAGGCRTSVEIKMDNVEDCRDVLGFHQVVTLGNHRRMVEAFCQLYGITVVHSPEHTMRTKAA